MSEDKAKYVKQSTTMKLNYKWEALNQHAEDESYYWTELYTPIGSFTIATNRTSESWQVRCIRQIKDQRVSWNY